MDRPDLIKATHYYTTAIRVNPQGRFGHLAPRTWVFVQKRADALHPMVLKYRSGDGQDLRQLLHLCKENSITVQTRSELVPLSNPALKETTCTEESLAPYNIQVVVSMDEIIALLVKKEEVAGPPDALIFRERLGAYFRLLPMAKMKLGIPFRDKADTWYFKDPVCLNPREGSVGTIHDLKYLANLLRSIGYKVEERGAPQHADLELSEHLAYYMFTSFLAMRLSQG